jgi:hypothetical protein
MLSLKQGVDISKLSPQMAIAANIATWCFIEESYHTVITSACDGKHGDNSLHYFGDAMDLRIRHIPAAETVSRIMVKLKENLGDNYDVVLESDHIHVEYQPKR